MTAAVPDLIGKPIPYPAARHYAEQALGSGDVLIGNRVVQALLDKLDALLAERVEMVDLLAQAARSHDATRIRLQAIAQERDELRPEPDSRFCRIWP